MRTEAFDYDLPAELIAQEPVEPRDRSRLLVVGPQLQHRSFHDLPQLLSPGDLVVFNRTRVIPARLHGRKSTGGRVEVLLLRPAAVEAPGQPPTWEALVRPGRRVQPGTELLFGDSDSTPERGGGTRLTGRVLARTAGGGRLIAFAPVAPGQGFAEAIDALGETPLPPYITSPLTDPERYQTIFARDRGSVAAPTAGLHFTPAVMAALAERGVERAWVTLHIGLDTFRPVREERVEDHEMHREWFEVPAETADAVADCRRRGGRVVACGTTVVRTLEAAADPERSGLVAAGHGETDLFIYPGYRFRVVDVMLTNFHLPRSTLLMLVSAFGGTERVLAAYREATRLRYRFYSFGDAMLIFPAEPEPEETDPAGAAAAGTGPVEGDRG